MRAIAALLVLAANPGVARADAKPVSSRWAAELPAGTIVWEEGIGNARVELPDGGELSLGELGCTGPLSAARLPRSLGSRAPCQVTSPDPAAPRVTFLECERGPLLQAILEHDDGLLLSVTSRRNAPALRALVRALAPTPDQAPCAAECVLGHRRWITLHAEEERRLFATVDATGMDIYSTVHEVAPAGAERLRISLAARHAYRARPKAKRVGKVVVLGVALPAYRRDEGLALFFRRGAGGPDSIQLWGRTPDDLDRAVRMIEAATPGPEHDLPIAPAYERHAKTLGPTRSRLPWALGAGLLAVLAALALWRVRRGTRRATDSPAETRAA